MNNNIVSRIAAGEHQRQEFKFEVADFRKIARTLVSFSNTDGGSLLIGVKDNGAIAGVRSEEEFFMIEGAARMYCRPEVMFTVREWKVDQRKILEVMIGKGQKKPYLAQDEQGKWVAYIRKDAENLKAPGILLKLWEREKEGEIAMIKFREAEKQLLEYLESHPDITVSKFRRLAGLTLMEAEEILVNFCLLGLIQPHFTATSTSFSLREGYLTIINRYI